MEPIIRDYIENLFSSAPRTKQAYELKEEIIRNTIDRYHDLIDEGKSDGDAYNQAIAGIGDINELIDELRSEECFDGGGFTEAQSTNVRKRSRVFHSVAAALYIMCIAPCVITGVCSVIPVMSLAFYMISAATGLLIYCHMTRQIPFITDEAEKSNVKLRAVFRSVGVGLYISCITPVFFVADSYSEFAEAVAIIFMFLMIAAATVLVILSRGGNTYTKADDTMVESFKEWNGRKKRTSKLYSIITAIIWGTAAVIFFILNFATDFYAVVVSWIIFLIAFSVQKLVKAIFDYREAGK